MGCARRVHATLGFGFLESAYGDALEIEFRKSGIPYVREDAVRIYYDGQPLPTVWRADFTCFERRFIVELKAVKALTKIEWGAGHPLSPRHPHSPRPACELRQTRISIRHLRPGQAPVCFGHRRVTDKGPAGRCHWLWLPRAKRRRSGSGAPLKTLGV